MSIKIRQQEPAYTLTKIQSWWLDLLVFLTEFKDQAANEEIEKIVAHCIKQIREFVLSPNHTDEFTLELHKSDALDLFLFLSDFKTQAKEKDNNGAVIQAADSIKDFLTKRGNEDE